MKFILVLTLLCFSYVVYAQTDTDAEKTSKPSWSSNLPDRNDAPEIDTDEEDEGLSGLTMDRSALFSDDEDSNLVIDDSSEIVIKENDGSIEQEKQTEADRIAEQEKQAEVDRIAEQEKQAEADRIAEQEKQAEADRIAEQEKQAETDRIAKQEKLAEDQKRAAEKRALEQKQITETTTNTAENTQKPQVRTYTWKKTKNFPPEYPTKAARDRQEGWVDVEFTIDNSGKVLGAHPIKTYKNLKIFNKAALRAVRQWKFDPPSNYGINKNQTKTVRIVFNLAK